MTPSPTTLPDRAAPRRARRGRVLGVAVVLLLLCAPLLECWRLGYPYGPVFSDVPAGAPASGGATHTAAVFLSGDLGFNTGMGPRIAERLARQGMPVVAINSLAAFAGRGSPEQAAQLLSQAVRRATGRPGIDHVLLIGQSFGANIILAGVPHLPRDVAARITLIELVVPTDTIAFRATPAGLFSGSDGAALPYARAVRNTPVLCIHGNQETGSLCPEWHQANVASIGLPGAHLLRRDSALVAAVLLRAYMESRTPHGGAASAAPIIQPTPAVRHRAAA